MITNFIKLLKRGSGLGTKAANKIIGFYNSFQKIRVVQEDPPEVLISDSGVVIKIGKATSGGGGGSSNYRGEYSPDGATQFNPGPFVFGDEVRVSPANAVATTSGGAVIPGTYKCVLDGPTPSDLPNHILSSGSETVYWHWMSTWPSVRQMCDDTGDTIDVFTDAQDKPT